METIGIVLAVVLIAINALSFFGSSSKQDRVYRSTVADTSFNKERV